MAGALRPAVIAAAAEVWMKALRCMVVSRDCAVVCQVRRFVPLCAAPA
jgi:hypothetical protein